MIIAASRRRPKVLVCAYSANPLAQSEPLNGYKFARELHRVTDIRFIAHARDWGALSASEVAGVTHYAGSARLANTLRRIGQRLFGPESWHLLGALEFFDYLRFDLDCVRIAESLRASFPFDVVHRVTPSSVRVPTFLWRLGAPLVLGPQLGGMEWPQGFRHLGPSEKTADWLRPAGSALRALLRDLARADRILVGTQSCYDVLPPSCRRAVSFMCEIGVDCLPELSAHAGEATRLLYVGRFVACKCTDVLLRAMPRLPPNVRLTLVGDGPERPRLEALVDALGLQGRVTFVGWVRQGETARYYREAGVFVFPSVRESTGAVILEAMAHGLPVVAANWGGPAAFLKDGCGILLPVDGPKALEDGIVRAVNELLAGPARGREIGGRGRERVAQEYLWPQKAQRLLEIYEEVLAEGRP